MKKLLTVMILGLALLLAGCSTSSSTVDVEDIDEAILGTWEYYEEEEGVVLEQTYVFNEDGTFKLTSSSGSTSQSLFSTEFEGVYLLDGDILTLTNLTVDGQTVDTLTSIAGVELAGTGIDPAIYFEPEDFIVEVGKNTLILTTEYDGIEYPQEFTRPEE